VPEGEKKSQRDWSTSLKQARATGTETAELRDTHVNTRKHTHTHTHTHTHAHTHTCKHTHTHTPPHTCRWIGLMLEVIWAALLAQEG